MGLIDSASLVVTPNSYKATKLYSIIPDNGSGDMTFARTGDTATRVNSSGLIESVTANKPRLDYLGSTCPKLLLEPQRTNLFLRSEEFDNASWLKDSGGVGSIPVVTANNAISPDGTQDADLIVFNLNGGTASGDLSYVGQTVTTTVSTTYTFTFYAKTSDNSTKVMSLVNGNGVFTLITITSSWQRFSITYTASLTTSNIRLRLRGSASGEGTSTSASIHLWGAQLEVGAYATSYIPTTTASVTRNADSCTKTSATALIGQTEGTIFWDGIVPPSDTEMFVLENASPLCILRFRKVSTSLRCQLYIDSLGYNYTPSTTAYSVGQRVKMAFAYKSGDLAFYINGTQINIATSTFSSLSLNTIRFANDLGTAVVSYNQNNSASIWKTRLSNQELATLTTL